MDTRALLVSECNTLCSQVNAELKQAPNRRNLAEAAISLVELDRGLSLDALNQAATRLLINKCESELGGKVFFYAAFYNLPTLVYKKDFSGLAQNVAYSNLLVTYFRIRMYLSHVLGFSLSTSEDEYFFIRFEKIEKAVYNFLNYPFEFDFSSFVFLVLNYYQALLEYANINDTTYEEQCRINKTRCERLLVSIFESEIGSDAISSSRQLMSFWNSMVPHQMSYDFDPLIAATASAFSDADRWVLLSLYKYDSALAEQIYSQCVQGIICQQYINLKKTALNVRILVAAYQNQGNTSLFDDKLSIHVTDDKKASTYQLDHFFNYYDEIKLNKCTPDELRTLYDYDDEILREKLAACMINVDLPYVATQMVKPHTGHEISDMDIPFREKGELKYLCIPVKSGKEIKEASVSEKIAYQIYKPFSHFGANCIVAFVTAKPIGAALDSYIKRMSTKAPDWHVYVLQENQLAYLLKLNGLLT